MAIESGTPRRYFDGIEDNSGGTVPDYRDEVPMHCPLWFIQAPQGLTTPQFLSLSAAQSHYGAEAFNEFTKYHSHQTMGAKVSGATGMAFFMRCVSETAKKAKLRLSVEVAATATAPALTLVDGYPSFDADGNLKVSDTETGASILYRWFVESVPEVDDSGAVVTPGPNPESYSSSDSKVYPIFDFTHKEFGAGGNNSGIRISIPDNLSSTPVDSAFVENSVLPVRFQCVKRSTSTASPVIQNTLLTAKQVDIGIIDNVVRNGSTNLSFFHNQLQKAYTYIVPGEEIKLPVIGETKFYKANYEAVVEQLFTAENLALVAAGREEVPVADKFLTNPFSLKDFNGQHILSARHYAGSLVFSSSVTLYMRDGDDGLVSEAALETMVIDKMDSMWEDPEAPMADRLRYPFHHLWDTGFAMPAKLALMKALSSRIDVSVEICTQDINQPANDLATEISVGATLDAALAMYPESTVHGTSVCRGAVWAHCGEFTTSLAGRQYPAIMDIIKKAASSMSSIYGIRGNRVDRSPYNEISDFVGLTNQWAPDPVRDTMWKTGVNYVQSKGLKKLFWPAMQTSYSDDTSILNSWFNRVIAVDIISLQDYIWTQLTGNSDLETTEFIKESNRLFDALTADRYQGRVTLERETYFTELDVARNYSWTMDVTMRGNGMKTAGALNLIAARQLTQA